MLPFGNTVITLDQDLVLNICVSKVWFQPFRASWEEDWNMKSNGRLTPSGGNSLQSAKKEENTIAGFK
jgi:hypothetical protein